MYKNTSVAQNIILTQSQYQNTASTFTQQHGGAVAVSHTVFVNQNSMLTLTSSNSTMGETWGLKLAEWHQSNAGDYGVNYTDSGLESAILKVGVMVSPMVYVISSSSVVSHTSSDEYEALCDAAKTLNRNTDLNVWIIKKDGYIIFYPKPKQ